MVELISQIDSKITACCHFMQPIGNRLVPSMLAAGDNRKIALVRIFCENDLCNSIPFNIHSMSFFTPPYHSATQKGLALVMFLLINCLSVTCNATLADFSLSAMTSEKPCSFWKAETLFPSSILYRNRSAKWCPESLLGQPFCNYRDRIKIRKCPKTLSCRICNENFLWVFISHRKSCRDLSKFMAILRWDFTTGIQSMFLRTPSKICCIIHRKKMASYTKTREKLI